MWDCGVARSLRVRGWAGARIFGDGILSQPRTIIATDCSLSDGHNRETRVVVGAFWITEVRARGEALGWWKRQPRPVFVPRKWPRLWISRFPIEFVAPPRIGSHDQCWGYFSGFEPFV